MATLGNTPRPAYVYDTETDTWVPIGVGAHTHAYIPNTLVDAKGDIITATADDTPAKLSKGSDGTVLVADSTTSTGLAWQPYAAQVVAGKNLIINGGFDIWQRGTSFTNSASALAYTADRWHQARNATGMTISRQATNDTTNLPFIQYCSRVARDSGNTSTEIIRIVQSIETVNSIPFLGKTVTLSFYARKGANYSDANSQVVAQVLTGTGIDQNVNTITGAAYPIASAATLTTTWQRFSYTGTVSSSASQIHILFYGTPVGTAGAADYFEVTGVQLEVGSTATPFSRAGGNIQGELAACQRYYWRDVYGYIASGLASSTTVCKLNIPFPVTMRVTPTAFDYSGLGVQDGVNYYTNGTWGLAGNGSKSSGQVIYTHVAASLVQYRPYFLGWNDGNTYLGFSAEL